MRQSYACVHFLHIFFLEYLDPFGFFFSHGECVQHDLISTSQCYSHALSCLWSYVMMIGMALIKSLDCSSIHSQYEYVRDFEALDHFS